MVPGRLSWRVSLSGHDLRSQGGQADTRVFLMHADTNACGDRGMNG
ncbi:MAG: hypothetical protein QOG11_1277, partial [Solirubrobacteraceae bacterium]|nr:hypothetical protein [Solirubrobacteraceae bacterium]